ncbi:hypothetical protein B9Z19DRAFT_1137914 [Tuber borchii]|uniref:Uncharacterized protein n=1 Tax=Tuber borchii TaxID=42251 RepID=A0A2T6ZA90_TUBBO|nr:hypothetical protein B9Z19DRAFT_1137914 [Tuber borchii]
MGQYPPAWLAAPSWANTPPWWFNSPPYWYNTVPQSYNTPPSYASYDSAVIKCPPPVIHCPSPTIIQCAALTVQATPAGQDLAHPSLNQDLPARLATEDPPLPLSQHPSPHAAQPQEAPTPDAQSHLTAEDSSRRLLQHPPPNTVQPQEVPAHHAESKNEDPVTKGESGLPKLGPGGSMAARAKALVGQHFGQILDGQTRKYWEKSNKSDKSEGGGGDTDGRAVEGGSGAGEKDMVLVGKHS